MNDMTGEGAWKRLGELLMQRRLHLGQRNRAQFARDNGISDRLLSDIENGKRTNYDRATLVLIEGMYGWAGGSVAAVLAGRRPTTVTPAEVLQPTGDNSDALLLERPIGVSDEAWASLKDKMAADYRFWLGTQRPDDDA